MKNKNNMRFLINASNLHCGGGIQVAVSFINELAFLLKKNKYKESFTLALSTKVKDNLTNDFDMSVFSSVHEVNSYGLNITNEIDFNYYDVVFTIFGPFYSFKFKGVSITGFAQPWIAYKNNLVYRKLDLFTFFKTRLKFFIQSIYFKFNTILIVEAEHVKKALVSNGYERNSIFVVSNSVSTVYDKPELWKKINYYRTSNYTLGFIGRNYIHKNLNILKAVNDILVNKYHLSCDFLFTLTDEEMKNNKFDMLDNFISVGALTVEQCPSFYQQIDALIFPSLLECFSATPIEAMKMEKLVIASDLPFVTDICKSSARYFDPLSAESIAMAIYSAINEPEKNQEMIINAKKLVDNLPTAKDRAEAYLDILLNMK